MTTKNLGRVIGQTGLRGLQGPVGPQGEPGVVPIAPGTITVPGDFSSIYDAWNSLHVKSVNPTGTIILVTADYSEPGFATDFPAQYTGNSGHNITVKSSGDQKTIAIAGNVGFAFSGSAITFDNIKFLGNANNRCLVLRHVSHGVIKNCVLDNFKRSIETMNRALAVVLNTEINRVFEFGIRSVSAEIYLNGVTVNSGNVGGGVGISLSSLSGATVDGTNWMKRFKRGVSLELMSLINGKNNISNVLNTDNIIVDSSSTAI